MFNFSVISEFRFQNILPIIMNYMIIPNKSFSGKITLNMRRNFAFFSMNTPRVKMELRDDIRNMNQNIQNKNLSGKIVLCEMTKHDGMFL